MIRIYFLIKLTLVLNVGYLYAQTGTVGAPYTSIHQAAGITTAGIYYFNIGGTAFDTYVDANGYVQVAIDFGNGVSNLPQGTSLTNAARGILNPTVLATLTETQEVRLSSSTGNFDVTTTNTTIISRIQSNTTLHRGIADNAINDGWTGTNSIYITTNASCGTSSGVNLHKNIVHGCGNTNVTHWIPFNSLQMEKHALGQIANTAYMQLWVKGNVALPIELLSFNAVVMDKSRVNLNWQTASEINNDYFTIERSNNGIDWEELKNIDGAGNSSTLLNYSSMDSNPFSGTSYYRLKQTDFDGKYSYSQIISLNITSLEDTKIEIYPNPTDNQITITGNESELKQVKIYNTLGQDVTFLTKFIINGNSKLVIDLSSLNIGIYYIKTKTTANMVYKQ